MDWKKDRKHALLSKKDLDLENELQGDLLKTFKKDEQKRKNKHKKTPGMYIACTTH